MVDFGTWVMRSNLMHVGLTRGAVLGALRHTFYDHFCAGEDAAAAGESVRSLHLCGLRSMLDYAVEYAGDNDSSDRNLEAFLHTIDSATSLPPSSVSFNFHTPFLPSILL
jgi:proline dehydrogenase